MPDDRTEAGDPEPSEPPQAGPPAEPGRPTTSPGSNLTADRARMAAVTVATGLFLQNVDSLTIALALPAIAETLKTDALSLSIAMTGYMIATSVFIPASGWIADRFGSRNVFCIAMAAYALAGVMAATADSVAHLVMARIAQGACAALTVPVGRLLLLRAVPKRELLQAMTWLTLPSQFGPIIGPPLGGLIVSFGSWRAVFLFPVPVALLGIVMALRYLPKEEAPTPPPFDGWGFVLVSIATIGLVLGCEALGQGWLPPPLVAGLFAVTLAAVLLYLRHRKRHPAPVLTFESMRIDTFRAAVWSGIPLRIGVGAVPLLQPLMLQLALGYSAADSGFLSLAPALGALCVKPATTLTVGRFGFRTVLILNGVACAATLAACAGFFADTHWAWIAAVLFVGGLVRSLQFTAINTMAYADIEPRRMAAANSMYSMMQQVTLALGLALGALALGALPHLRGAAQPQGQDYRITFLFVAVTQLWMVWPLLRLPRDAGASVSGVPRDRRRSG